MKVIECFDGEYDWLSNFYVEKDGLTVEHRFQASKTLDTNEASEVMACDTPGKAKRAGRKVTMRKDWEAIKGAIMYNQILRKFTQDDELKEKLMETDGIELIEGNNWHDCYWGECSCSKCDGKEKKNVLGQILMMVREYLIQQELGSTSATTDPNAPF